MLDTSNIRGKLTQGQAEAEMVLRSAPQAMVEQVETLTATAPKAVGGAGAAGGGAAGGVDVETLARKVLSLMRQDLATQRERRGGRQAR